MEARIIKREILKDVHSASGVEIVGDEVYIIGDDSPYLYIMDKNLKFVRKILLTKSYKLVKGKIPKTKKPDLEALASFDIGGDKVILILGSGSVRETRDKAFIVETGEKDEVSEYSLLPLYDLLRKHEEIVKDRVLNIEAATVVGEHIYLFQRGNVTGFNVMIEFPLYSFIHFLQDKNNPSPKFKIYNYSFERYNGLMPGFSGAACIPGSKEILFSTSLEDTNDEWYDGDVFESFLGILTEDREKYTSTVIKESGEPYKGKVESVTILNQNKGKKFEVLAVTDSDGGASEMLLIELKR
ncbi:MAG: hypothetical protein M3512_12765 [Bacteroidota bacterium]|nr:hypothetical protein [Bacteroidota bacterium]